MRRYSASSGAILALVLAHALTPSGVAQAANDYTEVCRFTDTRLDEISGLTRSVRHQHTLWALSDSSGGPYIYAVDERTCEIQATVRLEGTQARDFEAIAVGRDARGRPTIWVGDIGDNRDSWPTVELLAVREPRELRDQTARVRQWAFTYPDRPHDAETLLADPRSPRLWVVTKQLAHGALVDLTPVLSGGRQAREVTTVGGLVTDGAISPDGSRYVLRDYVDARIFRGSPPGREVLRLTLPAQPQGEAITWSAEGDALLIASEGDDRLLRIPISDDPANEPAVDAQASPGSEPNRPEEPQVDDRQQVSAAPTAAVALILGGVVAISAILLFAEWARRRGGAAG